MGVTWALYANSFQYISKFDGILAHHGRNADVATAFVRPLVDESLVKGCYMEKPPLKWTAVLFAFAACVMLVTVTNGLVQTLRWPVEYEVLATLVAPLLAGILTALYVPYRGAMHAFLGGLLSIMPLAVFIFGGVWQFAVFAGAFCTLGGAFTELALRRRRRTA
jgi:hypothetical protein